MSFGIASYLSIFSANIFPDCKHESKSYLNVRICSYHGDTSAVYLVFVHILITNRLQDERLCSLILEICVI